jgi:cell division protein FtsW (lipid II flippase)
VTADADLIVFFTAAVLWFGMLWIGGVKWKIVLLTFVAGWPTC